MAQGEVLEACLSNQEPVEALESLGTDWLFGKSFWFLPSLRILNSRWTKKLSCSCSLIWWPTLTPFVPVLSHPGAHNHVGLVASYGPQQTAQAPKDCEAEALGTGRGLVEDTVVLSPWQDWGRWDIGKPESSFDVPSQRYHANTSQCKSPTCKYSKCFSHHPPRRSCFPWTVSTECSETTYMGICICKNSLGNNLIQRNMSLMY